MSKERTPAQQCRQSRDFRNNGRYAKVNPCYHCGKSAGVNYCSHPQTDIGDFADLGLCLCVPCLNFLSDMPVEEAKARLTLSNFGSNPQPRR